MFQRNNKMTFVKLGQNAWKNKHTHNAGREYFNFVFFLIPNKQRKFDVN